MKTFRELYFEGTEENLSNFVNEIKQGTFMNWRVVIPTERMKNYLMFDYLGDDFEQGRVSIYLGDSLQEGKIQVGNIVPLEKSKLSLDEYNALLIDFYNIVISPYKHSYKNVITITEPTSDTFNPLNVISEAALNKLRQFCISANKSTGSSHPNDQERWFDFICQTVDDGRLFDYSTLSHFLSDENYWGTKEDGFVGSIGNFPWDKESAAELALEYESLSQIVQYYKNKKGV